MAWEIVWRVLWKLLLTIMDLTEHAGESLLATLLAGTALAPLFAVMITGGLLRMAAFVYLGVYALCAAVRGVPRAKFP